MIWEHFLNNCKHETQHEKWVTTDHWGDETEGYWEFWTTSSTVDLDIHRYKCTMCGRIMYYSGAAREYYEKGTRSHVFGLDK